MRIDVQAKECKFIVKEKERKVICIIENSAYDVIHFIRKYIWWVDDDIIDKEKLTMPHTFVGVASCAKEDKWDESIGKKIAYYKAKYKYVISFFKHANALVNRIDEETAKIERAFNNYGLKMDKNMAKLEASLKDYLTFSTEN